MFRLLDTVLDRTIVGGYTKIGYEVRSRAWGAETLPSLAGKTVLVTGATSGLGEAAARGFSELGASVVLLVRDTVRGQRIADSLPGPTTVVACDLADLTSVSAAAARVAESTTTIEVLVNNAGVLPANRETSAQGHELTFATNVLGPFALTQALLPRLAGGRVIDVSSGGMYGQKLDVDTLLNPPEPFDGVAAYARTKRAEVVLAQLHGEREPNIGFHAMHPGWADTAGVKSSLPTFHKLTKPLLRTPAQGADTIVWLGATATSLPSGRFWHDRAQRPTHLLPWTRESAAEREQLWATVSRLTGASPAGA